MGSLRQTRKVNSLIKQGQRYTAGFTLLELVVVIAIIGIMLSLIAPSLSQRLSKEEFTAMVYQIHSDIRMAQEVARREECPVSVSFYQRSKVQNMYIIRKKDIGQDIVKTVDMPQGIKVEYTGETTITFNKDGGINKNGHITIYQGQERRYIYFYQTGRVRVSAKKI